MPNETPTNKDFIGSLFDWLTTKPQPEDMPNGGQEKEAQKVIETTAEEVREEASQPTSRGASP